MKAVASKKQVPVHALRAFRSSVKVGPAGGSSSLVSGAEMMTAGVLWGHLSGNWASMNL